MRVESAISRILSPTTVADRRVATICLGSVLPPASVRPTWDGVDEPPRPCLALLRMGDAQPARSPGPLVVSYTTVSP